MAKGHKGGNRFVISDTHFGHSATWEKFKLSNGEPLRPFSSTEEMDEAMVERWNSVVTNKDSVYHLGDVVIARRHLETVKRLNGRKILIMGNHDIFSNKDYHEAGFESLHGVRVFTDRWVLSHIPLHPDSVGQRFRMNVHGHLHGGRVMRDDPFYSFDSNDAGEMLPAKKVLDPRYYSACVENLNFTPLSFDDLEIKIQDQWKELNYTPPEKAGWGNGSGAS